VKKIGAFTLAAISYAVVGILVVAYYAAMVLNELVIQPVARLFDCRQNLKP
jgi:hypothetical protein